MTLIPKYCRTHPINVDVTRPQALMWLQKLIYEFWGFCMHGNSNLTGALGFVSGGIAQPAGFENGSTLMSGSSGFTVVGTSTFNDASADFFSISIKDKFLVTWIEDSTSNDNGVYLIKKVVTSSSIIVETNNGATPYSASLEPLFDTRSNINYRVVDIASTAQTISYVSGNGLVMNLSGASSVNAGQLTPQFRIKFTEASPFDDMELSWSPSGSWDGTKFATDNIIHSNKDWHDLTVTGQGSITLIAADDFMICHQKGTWNTNGSGFHIEIPERLYPQGSDPNPIVGSHWINDPISTSLTSTNYGMDAWKMHHPPNNTVYTFTPLTKASLGSGFHTNYFTGATYIGGIVPGRYSGAVYNPLTNRFFASDVILSLLISDNFCLARVRMRRFRLVGAITPSFTRLGDDGEWLHINQSVAWPWDNAILPDELLKSGI